MSVMIEQELPGEIITEILLRLPVKSLIRFKCVSKSWYFMISSSSFSRWHLNHVNDSVNGSVIVSSYADEDYFIGEGSKEDIFVESMDVHFAMIREENFHYKCCCDGMLCVAIGIDTLMLWNPSIRVNKRLPLPPSNHIHAYWAGVFGFGYDSSIGDYKVVSFHSKNSLLYFHVPCHHPVYVLTLRTNSWKKIEDIPYNIHINDRAIPVNGGLYWRADLDDNPQKRNLILRFDLAEETFKEVAMPPLERRLQYNLFVLGNLKGSLSMFCKGALWVMKGEGVLWSKIIIFTPPPPQEYSTLMYLTSFTKSGKVVFADTFQETLVMYDPKVETYKKLDIRGSSFLLYQAIVYNESLISPENVIGMERVTQEL